MDQESNHLTSFEKLRLCYRKWFLKEIKRDIILPVAAGIALQRLQIAFANTITVSNGFLFAKYKYDGQVNENKIDVNFSVRTRSKMYYSMHGEVSPHPKGSRLTMTINDESPAWILFVIPMFFIFLMKDGVSVAIPFFIVFIPVAYFVMAWHRSSAADNVTDLVCRIVCSKPVRADV